MVKIYYENIIKCTIINTYGIYHRCLNCDSHFTVRRKIFLQLYIFIFKYIFQNLIIILFLFVITSFFLSFLKSGLCVVWWSSVKFEQGLDFIIFIVEYRLARICYFKNSYKFLSTYYVYFISGTYIHNSNKVLHLAIVIWVQFLKLLYLLQ